MQEMLSVQSRHKNSEVTFAVKGQKHEVLPRLWSPRCVRDLSDPSEEIQKTHKINIEICPI